MSKKKQTETIEGSTPKADAVMRPQDVVARRVENCLMELNEALTEGADIGMVFEFAFTEDNAAKRITCECYELVLKTV